MLTRPLAGCLLVVLLLAPLSAYGQRTRESTSQSASPAPDAFLVATGSSFQARVKERIVRLTNQFRKQKGRRELKGNADLSRAAQYFANYLARTGKFSHTADGKEPWERASEYGYRYCIVSENIAYRYNSAGFTVRRLADEFMTGWKKSPGHRRNLLDRDIDEIGVGVARNKKTGRYYAVQDFGRPASKAIVFRITNRTDAPVSYRVDGKSYSVQPRYTITFRRCRPPELALQAPDESQPAEAGKGQVVHPQDGSHYVIRKDRAGAYTLEKL